MLSEGSQTHTELFHLYKNSYKIPENVDQSIVTGGRAVVVLGQGQKEE